MSELSSLRYQDLIEAWRPNKKSHISSRFHLKSLFRPQHFSSYYSHFENEPKVYKDAIAFLIIQEKNHDSEDMSLLDESEDCSKGGCASMRSSYAIF